MSGGESAEKEKRQRRVEFSFPLLIVRTQFFTRVFDRLGSFRFSRHASWVSLAIVPVVAAIGLFLIITSLFVLLWNPAVGDFVREAGLGMFILLPVLNPYLPILYGWFAIVVALVIHEGAHGIAARSLGLGVKSSGLFVLAVLIGAFVEVDEEQLKKVKARVSSRVMAAGVGANVVVAAACLMGVLLIVGGLTPAINGVYVSEVTQGLPAQAAGLKAKDVFVSVDGVKINRTADFNVTVGNKNAGDTVQVVVARGEQWKDRFSTTVNLTLSENRIVMGVQVGDLLTEERVKNYVTVTPETASMYLVPPAVAPGLAPFSDSFAGFYTSPLGSQWPLIANTLFWLWFVNVNLAVFNALPIYPLDGGRMFNIALKSAFGGTKKKLVSAITMAVTAVVILVFMLTVIVPFVT